MPIEYATDDGHFALSAPGDPDYTVVLNFPHVVDDRKGLTAILAFRVYPTKSGTNLKFAVSVEGFDPSFQATIQYLGTSFRTVHEVVPNHIFKQGPNNLVFKITEGKGVVEFNSIVVWYRATS